MLLVVAIRNIKVYLSKGVPMASAATDFRTSLIPIFSARLQTLRAIVPGLRDLTAPAREELESLLQRAEAVIRESVDPVPAQSSHS